MFPIDPRAPRPRGGWLIILLCLAAAVFPLPAIPAGADEPAVALRRTVDEGTRILRDPAYHADAQRPEQHRRLSDLLYRDFDFVEFSKRVLAEKWNLFTPDQRREFVDVFSKFLTDYYVSRLQERYTNETVVYRRVDAAAPGRAVVKTGVTWHGREFPVDVRMHLRGGRWKAYDVSLLGLGAVQMYRAQFQEILRTHSPAETIALVRSRLDAE
jgi:ABC-type transporter MlaC component